MRKLSSFLFISLNGFYKDQNHQMHWHQHGREESEYSAESLKANNILLFGRITYQLMASFWPTPQAHEMDPATAKGMNLADKYVFTKTLKTTDWNNSKILNGNIADHVRQLKQSAPRDLTILGSGTLVAHLVNHNLIDEYQIMVDPIALPKGTSIFHGLENPLKLDLINSRTFKSGTLLLSYRPTKDTKA